MIKIINGNILEAHEDIICHQVNCRGAMGAGLAKQIKDKNPLVYSSYRTYCNSRSFEDLLGKSFIIISDDSKHYIANIFGQNGFGRGIQTNYGALQSGMLVVKQYARSKQYSVAIPFGIGCGLAGGDWSIVYRIIEDVFYDYDAVIYRLKR